MKNPVIEVEKARKLVQNFESLPAEEIKNVAGYLMGAINSKISGFGKEFENFESDFLVLSQNKMVPAELAEAYFSLKSLARGDFRKVDRDMVVVENWKNNVCLKKEYFEMMVDAIESFIISLD